MGETLQHLVRARQQHHGGSSAVAESDPIAELFHVLQMQSVFYTQAYLSAPWGMTIPAIERSLMFHLVVEGACIARVEGERICLQTGDFVLIPHGHGHDLLSSERATCLPLFDLPIETVSGYYERLEHGGGGARVQLLCGAVSFDHPIAAKLLAMMPGSIVIARSDAEAFSALSATITMLATECGAPGLGAEAVITRLADLLVIQGLRAWLGRSDARERGWLAAVQHPGVGKALRAVHREPGFAWSVAEMARVAAMSRTRFSETFNRLLHQSPMLYVTEWRMALAKNRLQSTADSILSIALDLGYQSEAAFGRAYKKTMGTTPGAVRKKAV